MLLVFLRCVCVLTSFATLFFMLSSPLRADLPTARIALQSRQFQLALAQAENLAATHPFDSAMIAARAHIAGTVRKSPDIRHARAGLGAKAGGAPHP
jgi:hypothetical protein